MSDRHTPSSSCEKVDCTAAMRQLWEFLDGELTPDRVTLIRAHLEGCRRCHPTYDFERRFLEALGEQREDCPCPEELKRRVMDSLRSAGYQGRE
ncbi:MAG: zf-HC2 domain-containing protein [Gemmatimonadaceae bacterium]